MLTVLFKHFGFLDLKNFYIIWFPNILALSVTDEGYSRNGSSAPNYISMICPSFSTHYNTML